MNAPVPSAAALVSLLRHLGLRAAIIDRERRLLAASEDFLRFGDGGEALALEGGRLHIGTAGRRVAAALGEAFAGAAGAKRVVRVGDEWLVTVLRHDWDDPPAAGVVVIVNERGLGGRVCPCCLGQAFQLTAREGDLAVLLAQGLPLAAAARRLRITMTTARTHLRHIFQKTGVGSQAELVALIAAFAFGRCPRPPRTPPGLAAEDGPVSRLA